MKKTKVIAFYLPQYYENEQNNKWWKKGFTEWTCIKEYSTVCKEVFYPRMPLNDNYYNLLDKDVMIWQANLADKYGIDGFAYYHYWMNGKMLLEKPAENLLKWKDVKQNFFFFWANHTWYKSKGEKKEILMEQTYGGSEDWAKHYEYMRAFFLDDRYIKVDNKPVVGIYKPEDVQEYQSMIEFFERKAIMDGLNGVYIIESLSNPSKNIQSKAAQAVVWRQSDIARIMYANEDNKKVPILIKKSVNKIRKQFGLSWETTYDYERMAEYEESLLNFPQKTKTFFCVSTGWNNMPRHGNFGQAIINFSTERFYKLFKKVYANSCKRENEFLFVNAWNEWAEGMNLEPDCKYEYKLLEIIKEVKEIAT